LLAILLVVTIIAISKYIKDKSYYSYLWGEITVSKNEGITLKDARYYNRKGCDLYDTYKYKEAIEYFDKAIKLNSNYDNAYYNKGLSLLYGLNKYEDAIKCFDKVIELNSKDKKAYYNKMISLFRCEKYKESLRVYVKLRKIDPNNESLKSFKSELLDEFHTYNNTLKCIDNALAFYGKDEELVKLKEEILEKQQEEKKYTLTIKEDMKNAEILINDYSKNYTKSLIIKDSAKDGVVSYGIKKSFSMKVEQNNSMNFGISVSCSINRAESTLSKSCHIVNKIIEDKFDIAATPISDFYKLLSQDDSRVFSKVNENVNKLISNELDRKRPIRENNHGFSEIISLGDNKILNYELSGEFRDPPEVVYDEENIVFDKAWEEKLTLINNKIQGLLSDKRLNYENTRFYKFTYKDGELVNKTIDFSYTGKLSNDRSTANILLAYPTSAYEKSVFVNLYNFELSTNEAKVFDFSKTETAKLINCLLDNKSIDYSTFNSLIKKYGETKTEQDSFINVNGKDVVEFNINDKGGIVISIIIQE